MPASHTHICPQTTCSIKLVLRYYNDLMDSGSELREQSTNLTYRLRVLFWQFCLSSRDEQKGIKSVIPGGDATVIYENLTKVLSSQLVPIKCEQVCLWKFNVVESLFLVILEQKMHSCNSDTLFLHKHGEFPQFSLGFFHSFLLLFLFICRDRAAANSFLSSQPPRQFLKRARITWQPVMSVPASQFHKHMHQLRNPLISIMSCHKSYSSAAGLTM